jgi:hypothetical protein
MIDWFVLLAPLLFLPIILLFAFTGCQLFFPVETPPPGPLFILKYLPTSKLTWTVSWPTSRSLPKPSQVMKRCRCRTTKLIHLEERSRVR